MNNLKKQKTIALCLVILVLTLGLDLILYCGVLVPKQAKPAPETIRELANLSLFLLISLSLIVAALIVALLVSLRRRSRLLHKKAYYNELTGSPTLLKFRKDAAALLEKEEHPYAAMRLSIEGLDFLNEIFGFSTGDEIIKAIAQTLDEMCDPDTECFAHIYGDRFVALFVCASNKELTARLADFEKRLEVKTLPLVNYKIKLAVGLYLVENGETDVGRVLENVGFAHHAAKQNNRLEEKVQFYGSKLKEALKLEHEVESKMEQALANCEFTMFLQPKFRLSDDTLEGAEALARWWVDDRYIMYPVNFIPIFEKNGFVVQLDMYMFEEACKFIRQLMDKGEPPITISCNFSRLHLLKGDFVSKLCKIADRYAVLHQYLEVEITESSMVGNEGVLMAVLAELHKEDFTLSMDDFGTGYSSLGLLKEIQIDVVKIDRSFFESSHEVEREQIVIESVLTMAKRLGIHTVAEGVETQEHIDFLRELGCDMVQGYYYAKPMPFTEFLEKYYG